MVSLSLEAVAILCYTAIALFLSLYFVPFKVVPRAWAKAVQTAGHPAQVALDKVLEGAAPKVAAAVKLPEIDWSKVPKPDLAGLQIQIPQDAIDSAVKGAMDKIKMERVRAGRGDVSEDDLARAQHAMNNPDGAALLTNALRAVDALVNNKVIKAATGKDWKKQLNDQYTATGDVGDLIKSLGFNLDGLGVSGGGGRTSVRGGPM